MIYDRRCVLEPILVLGCLLAVVSSISTGWFDGSHVPLCKYRMRYACGNNLAFHATILIQLGLYGGLECRPSSLLIFALYSGVINDTISYLILNVRALFICSRLVRRAGTGKWI